MIKYISIFRLVLRYFLVARKENLTGVSTGLTGRSKNLDPTGFHLCSELAKVNSWIVVNKLTLTAAKSNAVTTIKTESPSSTR